MNVTKSDIANEVAVAAEIPSTVAAVAVNSVFESITNHVAKGDHVTIMGFGTFGAKARKEYVGRNPQTSAAIVIAARVVPVFKAGKKLKESVNPK